MNSKHLHVISFNIPYPADYGGVIDVYYRIKALHQKGVKIHLHCFEYGREKSNELELICETVNYYKRNISFWKQISLTPYIVKTRNNRNLLNNLLSDDYPILFEGIHSCYFLNNKKLKNRLKIIRSHNIEHNYYKELATKTTNLKEFIYFNIESVRLNLFEKRYLNANYIATISKTDELYFRHKYGNTFLMFPSHPNEKVRCLKGKGAYIIYHANLNVKENEEAALFIIEKIVPYINFNFIVAGKNPSTQILKRAQSLKNLKLIASPTNEEMNNLVANAHINLLPTFQATGFKLKLLNTLFNGRFCICSPELVDGTGLEQLCIAAKTDAQFIQEINTFLKFEFTDKIIDERKQLLAEYTNSKVVEKLVNLL